MPATKISNPYDMKMSPSGQLLAVAGQEGLQIFHFNGSNPVTHYTALLTKEPVNQMFWDNDNHLYAISNTRSVTRLHNHSYHSPEGAGIALPHHRRARYHRSAFEISPC